MSIGQIHQFRIQDNSTNLRHVNIDSGTRVTQHNTIPSVTFRLLSLDKMQAYTLTKEVEGASYRELEKAGRYEGRVSLQEDRLDELNIFFVRQQISLSDCDIHIEAADVFCVEVSTPSIVNKLLKHIDCQLTFSFKRR